MKSNNSPHREDFLKRWKKAASIMQIPENAYNPQVKVAKDKSGRSNYAFGIILNPNRIKRPEGRNKTNCPLCVMVTRTKNEQDLVLSNQESQVPGFIIIPNKFPFSRGSSIAMAKETGSQERPLYTTNNLGALTSEMESIFNFAKERGLNAAHNGKGAGASISRHEHWHLIDFKEAYTRAGEEYGFENAQYERTKTTSQVQQIPEFPFAHLIFSQQDIERISEFLKSLGRQMGNDFTEGVVPHGVCQGNKGVLVIPSKKYKEKSAGTGDKAGHYVCSLQREFESADYNYCIEKLSQTSFKKKEINLEAFL